MTAMLGISGLVNAVSFKRSHWPDLEEREYRISQGHDAAAALIVDGQIVAAAAEERFNRQKHWGAFPRGVAEFCVRQAGLAPADLSEIAHAFNYAPYEEIYSLDPVVRSCSTKYSPGKHCSIRQKTSRLIFRSTRFTR